jgi:hypothetical protein
VERYYQIAKANLKFNLYPHLLISILFLCISPLLMGVENLDGVRTAQVLEMYVALVGIILFVPIFYPEQDKDIRDLTEAKFTSATGVYVARILEAVICLVLLVGIYIVWLKYNHCVFPVHELYLGTIAEALFLGGMGVVAYSISDQIAIAYMLPMVYYMMAISGGSKYLKSFYLFSMMRGSYEEKVYLAVTGVVFLLFGIGIRYCCRRFK